MLDPEERGAFLRESACVDGDVDFRITTLHRKCQCDARVLEEELNKQAEALGERVGRS